MKKVSSLILLFTFPLFVLAQELLSIDDVMKLDAGMSVNAFVKVMKEASARNGEEFNLSNYQDEDIPDELIDLVEDSSKLRSYGTHDFSILVYDNLIVYMHIMLENIPEADQARLDQFYDGQWVKDPRLDKRSVDTWMNKGNAYSFKRYQDGTVQIHSADLKFIPPVKVEAFKAQLYSSAN